MMRFRRLGRSYHLQIRTVADLRRLPELDDAHWVATNAPCSAFSLDATFLALLDSDDNGRITCDEVRRAVEWTFRALRDTAAVGQGKSAVSLNALDADDEVGAQLLQAGRKLLARLGRPEATEASLADIRRVKAELERTPVSEGGVVLPEAAGDEDIRIFLADVVSAVAPGSHPTGRPGVGQTQLDDFLAAAEAHLNWLAAGEHEGIRPLGEATAVAWSAFAPLRDKLEQFFALCRAARIAPAVAERAWPGALGELDASVTTAVEAYLARAPLDRPNADGALRLASPGNPHYAAAIERFRRSTVAPLLGESVRELREAEWLHLAAALEPYGRWREARPTGSIGTVPLEKLRVYLEPRYRQAAEELVARSHGTALALENVRLLEKLALFQAYLLEFANNFASFPHLYDPRSRAAFEMGTLVVDGRRLTFAVRVNNRTEHAEVAVEGNMFVLYAEVCPPGGATPYEVALPLTAGGKGQLRVGKRGVFRDVSGRQYDARVVGIVENPVSVGEAMTAPFRRLGRMLSGRIESIGAAAEARFDTQAQTTVQAVPTGEEQPAEGPAAPQQHARRQQMTTGGLLVGGSVVLAALGSALTYIVTTLARVQPWQLATALGVTAAAVIVPITLVALFKLRRRDLGVVLEGGGWGINARMRLTRRQALAFTRRPRYPARVRARLWLIRLLVLAILSGAAWLAWRLGPW